MQALPTCARWKWFLGLGNGSENTVLAVHIKGPGFWSLTSTEKPGYDGEQSTATEHSLELAGQPVKPIRELRAQKWGGEKIEKLLQSAPWATYHMHTQLYTNTQERAHNRARADTTHSGADYWGCAPEFNIAYSPCEEPLLTASRLASIPLPARGSEWLVFTLCLIQSPKDFKLSK